MFTLTTEEKVHTFENEADYRNACEEAQRAGFYVNYLTRIEARVEVSFWQRFNKKNLSVLDMTLEDVCVGVYEVVARTSARHVGQAVSSTVKSLKKEGKYKVEIVG